MELKHKRTVEILRKRAWVARMNVKARHYQLIRKFCLTFVGRPKFVELIKNLNTKLSYVNGLLKVYINYYLEILEQIRIGCVGSNGT